MAEEKRSDSGNEPNHYALLGLHPSTSVREIRQAYRELSKLYHPDTTELPTAIATRKFQRLNEAYATLSNPERRTAYDRAIGYSRVVVVRPLPSLHKPNQPEPKSSAYLDATDRPLSPGELFALFILGVTFVGCLILAIMIGITRGDQAFQPLTAQHFTVKEIVEEVQPVQETPAQELLPSPETASENSALNSALTTEIEQKTEPSNPPVS
ncbi:DnaJ domain protein [Leptolyngbya boryana NIES-2135]|uniref:DnaJ domain protein n=1 Tax=Leptolyngbya boryana NIES-2135 TaxID=1973484 RepID=A0A1Z4JCM5_LEPBY|nr:J domain-containing protein [Leptolyngbya boryana]MBD1856814.1 J domain-containing protein [Leptolyngbya sp. FACHB-1624]MBD2370064.1 J domain-containing protein [Leptolyngbya sp. FACHB-161]MBD2376469.1 J domain-containing protein [Leptolyngbya sp. FACHB-238]MBD2400743.1 J domain-containing protein [Leptolyngbya sp. FACHB-239]MBD2407286.1 J domain-containing protein [Leptolyngbya sp. FACHB-402]BAY54428.1 DnaJ domain protein [Leptolyngbya boryana NIES-2135]